LIATEFFDVLLLIALALIFSRVIAYLFHRIKQPAVLGEIVAGLILGGLAILFFSGKTFNIFGNPVVLSNLNYSSNEFRLLAEIGILFLLFISGLEIRFSKLKKMEKASSLVAVGGVIVPLIFGMIAGILFDFSFKESIVIGLILTATSVGVTARTLLDLNVIDTDSSATILGSAVIDDIIGIILLTFALGIGSFIDAVWVGVRIAIFFLVFLYFGLKVINKILTISEKIQLPKAFLSISLAIFLLYAYFADKSGVAGIIGAFIAGILIGQNVKSRKIEEEIKTIGYGFFIPIFFVWVGALLWEGQIESFSSAIEIALFALIIIFISIVGKILGCGLFAKIAGLKNIQALQVGVGMVPRLELALIISTAAISKGFITGFHAHQILAATILMVVATTFITPFLLKATFKNHE